MGWFTKHEKYSKETGRFEPVQPKELTREEQLDPRWVKRQERKAEKEHYHQVYMEQYRKSKEQAGKLKFTPMERAGQGIDKISRNTRNYNTRNNYNPFGTRFDKGQGKKFSKKHKPIKPKSKPKKQKPFEFDMLDNWGYMR